MTFGTGNRSSRLEIQADDGPLCPSCLSMDKEVRRTGKSFLPQHRARLRNQRFTFDETMAELRKSFPHVQFNEQSTRMVLHRIYSDGDIIRVKKRHSSLNATKNSGLIAN